MITPASMVNDTDPNNVLFTFSFLDTIPFGNHTLLSDGLLHHSIELESVTTGSSSLTMQTKVQGVSTEGIVVALYHRPDKKLVEFKTSDVTGEVTFENLTDGAEEYYAVAFSEQDFNALVFDKLTAV